MNTGNFFASCRINAIDLGATGIFGEGAIDKMACGGLG